MRVHSTHSAHEEFVYIKLFHTYLPFTVTSMSYFLKIALIRLCAVPFFSSWLMLVTCAPDSNNLVGVNTFLSPDVKRRWQLQRLFEQGNKCFVLALALNHLGMHNKHTRVLYPKMHMSCSFLSLMMITAISMHTLLVKLPCKGLQTHTIFKNARQESPNTHVLCTHVCEV